MLGDKARLRVHGAVHEGFEGAEVRALCGPVKLLQTKLGKQFLYNLQGCIVCSKVNRDFPKLLQS